MSYPGLDEVHSNCRDSARNLLHYLALRRHDLRPLQLRLAALGLSFNCAHDDAAAWLRMIEHLKRAERSLGRPCRVVMDLAGPKLRTGPLEPGPSVVRIRPHRDVYGRVTAPARVWLTSESSPHPGPAPAIACIKVPTTWLARLRAGERVKFTDARDSRRTLKVVDVTQQALRALEDILQREQSHHTKKSEMLRHLTLADHFPGKR